MTRPARAIRWLPRCLLAPCLLAPCLLAACTDPALRPYQQALTAYDQGRADLDAGRPAEAALRFQEARALDPRSPTLPLWQARALAADHRLPEADATLTELIRAHPDLGVAWYNRAAYRARAGRAVESAQDLSRAIELKETSALRAAADPDFAPLRDDPAFRGVLPRQPLLAAVQGPEGAVFIGSRFTLTFRLMSLPELRPTLQIAQPEIGCLEAARLVEDRHEEADLLLRTVELTLIARAPCDTSVGPFTLRFDGGRDGEDLVLLDPVRVRVEAPSTAVGARAPALPSVLPLIGDLAHGAAAPVGQGVAARVDRGTPLSIGGQPPALPMELRLDGQPVAAGGWWPLLPPALVQAGEAQLPVR